jgi:hypothetical protein
MYAHVQLHGTHEPSGAKGALVFAVHRALLICTLCRMVKSQDRNSERDGVHEVIQPQAHWLNPHPLLGKSHSEMSLAWKAFFLSTACCKEQNNNRVSQISNWKYVLLGSEMLVRFMS